MAAEWQNLSVAEVAAQSLNAMVTGPFGSSISSRFFQSRGVPVIRGSNLTDTVGERLKDEGLVFLTPDKAAEFSRSVARRGDLVFTCWGTIGQVGLIDHRARYDEYIISNKQMKLTPDPSRFDSLFLYYVFSSPAISEEIKNQSIGSSVPGFNLGQLKAVRLRVPPLAEQRAIARILGALDDKIELNRKMNATLEAMARALFKSWFVDFDPVRAKVKGRAPSGMDAETAKLFPNELVDSKLGAIPKGWRVGNIGDVASNRRETVHPKDVRESSVYIGLEHLPRGRVFFENTGTPEDLESLKARFSSGDILFGKLRPYFKKVAIAPCAGICSTDILVLSPRPDASAYVTMLAASDLFIEHAVALSDGTRMPRTSWDQLTRFDAVVPSAAALRIFEQHVAGVFYRAEAARKENTCLSRLRDELLPRLISGELSVAGLERAVAEVA